LKKWFCFWNVQKGASSKTAGHLARGAYTAVREHDKGPRTQLVPFFNIPIIESTTQQSPVHSRVRQYHPSLAGH
jgi:hypothetical protein